MTSSRTTLLLGAILLFATGLGLRTAKIGMYGMSPDDGNYLFSAGMHRDDPRKSVLEQELAWLRWENKTYPHSYLHQLVIRGLHRAGANSVQAVRYGSGFLGALTPLLLILWYRGFSRDREAWRIGWLAAAMLAGFGLHVWLSRTGWGQIGCTFFWTVYVGLGYRLFHGEDRSARKLGLLAAGMSLATLGAYGYHEMIVVHVAGMGAYCVLAAALDRGRDRREVARTVLFFGLSCIAVTLWASTLLNDDFAQKHWSGTTQEQYGESYWQWRVRALEFLFVTKRLHQQLGSPVLVLSALGALALWRRDRRVFRYLGVTFLASWAILFFAFRDPYLIRIYLPTFVLLVVFAAEGWHAVVQRLAPGNAVAGLLLRASLPLFLLAQSTTTLFVESRVPVLTNGSLYYPLDQPNRYPLLPIVEYLRQHREPGEILGVSGANTPMFRLRDYGIPSRPFNGAKWSRPRSEWPTWLISARKAMRKEGRSTDAGGPYEPVVSEAVGPQTLYRFQGR